MEKKKNITFSYMASCGVEFFSAIAVGSLLGIGLDRYFDKSPLFLIIFFILGSIAGYFNVLRYIDAPEKEKNRPND